MLKFPEAIIKLYVKFIENLICITYNILIVMFMCVCIYNNVNVLLYFMGYKCFIYLNLPNVKFMYIFAAWLYALISNTDCL